MFTKATITDRINTCGALMSTKVVFDLGGVAIVWRPSQFVTDLHLFQAIDIDFYNIREKLLNAVFQKFEPDSDWANFDGNRISIEQLAANIAERIRSELIHWHGSPQTVLNWIESLPSRLTPIDDTLEWLRELEAANVPLYFLSNMPKPFIGHLVSQHQLFGHFNDGIFSGDVGFVKPQVAIFKSAADRFKFAHSDHVIFIDDHLPNVKVANQFGWQGIHHVNVKQSREILNRLI